MKTKPAILTVDDTPESLALLVKLLTQADYHVRPADSGELALASVAANPPDLILLDVRMKGIDGLEVCRRLKAREETRRIPIILISAFADVKEWVAGLQLGAVDYITKPFQTEELLTRVNTHLSLSRANLSLEEQAAALHQTNERLQCEITERHEAENKLRLSLDRAERSRQALLSALEDQKQAENKVQKLNAELEKRVTERTARLEAANQELATFTYSIAHDLRTPLRAISGFSQIIQEDYADKLDDEGQSLLDTVRASANKMGQLIDDLLEFARTGRGELSFSKIDMTALANSVCQEITSTKTRKGFECSVAPLPEAWGDLNLLRQVWFNLISNAVKFTLPKKTRRIEIGGYTEPGGNVYYVKDNGVGFDPAYIDKLFGVFQRLHSVEEFEGTGAGLAIVQRIIQRHGGRVWAEGKIDEGATFYFTLPKQRK